VGVGVGMGARTRTHQCWERREPWPRGGSGGAEGVRVEVAGPIGRKEVPKHTGASLPALLAAVPGDGLGPQPQAAARLLTRKALAGPTSNLPLNTKRPQLLAPQEAWGPAKAGHCAPRAEGDARAGARHTESSADVAMASHLHRYLFVCFCLKTGFGWGLCTRLLRGRSLVREKGCYTL